MPFQQGSHQKKKLLEPDFIRFQIEIRLKSNEIRFKQLLKLNTSEQAQHPFSRVAMPRVTVLGFLAALQTRCTEAESRRRSQRCSHSLRSAATASSTLQAV